MNGIFSALVGVFDDNGIPSESGIRQVVRHNIDVNGVDGLYVCGSTGENFLLPTEYKKTILKTAADEASNKCKLIAHVGSNIYEEIDELSKHSANCGYDAISAVTPFYYKFSADDIKEYYNYIAKKSSLPLIIYIVPLLTSINLSRDDFAEILSNKNIIGVKFTVQDFYLLERLRSDFPDKLFYSGFDETLLSATVLGTDGAIGSTFNLIGHWAKALFNHVNNNELQEARAIQKNINTVVDMLCKAGLYSTIKETLKCFGIDCGECRAPMSATTDTHREMAKKIHRFIREADEMATCTASVK